MTRGMAIATIAATTITIAARTTATGVLRLQLALVSLRSRRSSPRIVTTTTTITMTDGTVIATSTIAAMATTATASRTRTADTIQVTRTSAVDELASAADERS